MEKNITNNIAFHLGSLLDTNGDCGVYVFPNATTRKLLAGKTFTVKFSSYPIYKNGKCYELSTKITLDDYPEIGKDIIYPMAKRLAKEYDKMVEATERNEINGLINECRKGGKYECWHSFYDIITEDVILDTEGMTIEVNVGS